MPSTPPAQDPLGVVVGADGDLAIQESPEAPRDGAPVGGDLQAVEGVGDSSAQETPPGSPAHHAVGSASPGPGPAAAGASVAPEAPVSASGSQPLLGRTEAQPQPQPQPQSEPQPQPRVIFPGDESSTEMSQMVVAVESLPPDVEAWMSGEVAAAEPPATGATSITEGGEGDAGATVDGYAPGGNEALVAAASVADARGAPALRDAGVGDGSEPRAQDSPGKSGAGGEEGVRAAGGSTEFPRGGGGTPPGSGAAGGPRGVAAGARTARPMPELSTDLPATTMPAVSFSPASPSASSAGSMADPVLGGRGSR